MGYVLGIDLGTSRTAAAVFRNGRADVVPLSDHAATMPSMVFVRDDDEMLVGEAARRRGNDEPTRLAREFKRRFGDETPLVLGSKSLTAEQLTAALLRHVVDFVAQREGGAPDKVVVAHPANWGTYRRELLRREVSAAGLPPAQLVTEPAAAAVHYASGERVAVGDVIAVYDLGGGTFDATVLRRTATGFAQVGEPKGIERLGGMDFDEAVFQHVVDEAGLEDAALTDHDVSALLRLRDECRQAKEALSDDQEATIPVLVGSVNRRVKLTRDELEAMIRPSLRESVHCLRTAILDSGVKTDDISAVLMVGGSSRIPLASSMVRTELTRPVVFTSNPKEAVALGAARIGAGAVQSATEATAGSVTSPVVVPPVPGQQRPGQQLPGGRGGGTGQPTQPTQRVGGVVAGAAGQPTQPTRQLRPGEGLTPAGGGPRPSGPSPSAGGQRHGGQPAQHAPVTQPTQRQPAAMQPTQPMPRHTPTTIQPAQRSAPTPIPGARIGGGGGSGRSGPGPSAGGTGRHSSSAATWMVAALLAIGLGVGVGFLLTNNDDNGKVIPATAPPVVTSPAPPPSKAPAPTTTTTAAPTIPPTTPPTTPATTPAGPVLVPGPDLSTLDETMLVDPPPNDARVIAAQLKVDGGQLVAQLQPAFRNAACETEAATDGQVCPPVTKMYIRTLGTPIDFLIPTDALVSVHRPSDPDGTNLVVTVDEVVLLLNGTATPNFPDPSQLSTENFVVTFAGGQAIAVDQFPALT